MAMNEDELTPELKARMQAYITEVMNSAVAFSGLSDAKRDAALADAAKGYLLTGSAQTILAAAQRQLTVREMVAQMDEHDRLKQKP